MDNYEKTRVRKQITRLVKQKKLDGKRIVLFGASGFSKNILSCLREHGYTADYIVDNDIRKIGLRCLGLIVQTPETVLSLFSNDTAILFYSPGFFREITAQLEGMKYKNKHHFFVLNEKIDESLLWFSLVTFARFRGLYWYSKIKKGHARDCTVFIAPYTGIGDIYLTGLFFYEYIRRNNITDYVFTVVSNACRKVADLFDIQNVVVLPHQVGDEIICLKNLIGIKHNIVILNDGWLGDPLQWLRGYKGLNFEKMFRYFVFGFDDCVRHELPPYRDYDNEIITLFENYGLTKGKTVVLSPYSNTLFDLPVEFFETIVDYCIKQGLSVCTNCSEKEKPVPGTTAVFFQLDQAIAFMNAAGYFIGVRSGLCDVISSSSCKKVVLYEKSGLFYSSSQYDYFSLVKMGICSDAIEIEYSDDLINFLLTEICQALS